MEVVWKIFLIQTKPYPHAPKWKFGKQFRKKCTVEGLVDIFSVKVIKNSQRFWLKWPCWMVALHEHQINHSAVTFKWNKLSVKVKWRGVITIHHLFTWLWAPKNRTCLLLNGKTMGRNVCRLDAIISRTWCWHDPQAKIFRLIDS